MCFKIVSYVARIHIATNNVRKREESAIYLKENIAKPLGMPMLTICLST